jgi:predicted ABC-type transport system involved in lysophospholipase L1 biosynthesis ATPase subunit
MRTETIPEREQLLPTLSALENAVLPLDFARRGSKRERFERARHNLELVGLGRQTRPSARGAFGR